MPDVNAKGEKVFGKIHGRGPTHVHPEVSMGAIERQLYGNMGNGPRMLPR